MSPLDSVEAHHWTLPTSVCTCIPGELFPSRLPSWTPTARATGT